jgi:hypothetical protein
LLGVLNVGHSPVSCERNFIRLPFTPSVLQLVSEPVRSIVVLNRLCDRRRHGERCRKACGFQWRGFRLLKKPDSQLSFELGRAIWEIVQEAYVVPVTLDNTTQGDVHRYENNYKALNLITTALGRNVYDRVSHLETAHDVWLKLCNT